MNINKNTWHYKFWRETHGFYAPNQANLCSYCQRIFWYGLWWLLLSIAAITTLFYGIFYFGFYQHTKIAFIVLGAVVGVFSIVCLAVYITDLRDRQALENSSKPIKEHKPNLLFQWLSAKKQKVCPLIEFTDNNE